MTRTLLLLLPAAACATPPTPAPSVDADVRGLAKAAAPEAEPMLERVEDEDTRYVALPHFGECPYDPEEIPAFVPVDDGHVPGIDADRTRATNMYAGDESHDNQTLLRHLDAATKEVLGCIGVAACYETEPMEAGAIDVSFELDSGGRVRAVDVQPTANLDAWGVPACARRAVYETKFDDYDGGHMLVSYRIEID